LLCSFAKLPDGGAVACLVSHNEDAVCIILFSCAENEVNSFKFITKYQFLCWTSCWVKLLALSQC